MICGSTTIAGLIGTFSSRGSPPRRSSAKPSLSSKVFQSICTSPRLANSALDQRLQVGAKGAKMALEIIPKSVVRVSRGGFDPNRFSDVEKNGSRYRRLSRTEDQEVIIIVIMDPAVPLFGIACQAPPATAVKNTAKWQLC
jgi:hypothetical protein